MIIHTLKIIWNQRRSNGWIFAELLVVAAILWSVMDSLLVDVCTYYSPLGRDISNVYRVNLGKMNPSTSGYVPDSLKETSDGEDLVRLVDNLRQAPLVDEACISYAACPYTWSTAWMSVTQAGTTDTTEVTDQFQCFRVTPSYFDVFRIKSEDGKTLRAVVEQNGGELVISKDMETKLYNGQSGMGRKLKWSATSTETMTIAAVCNPIRRIEYERSEPCFYLLMRTDQDVVEEANSIPVQNMECMIRMKDGFRAEDMENFLQGMDDRLTVNNLYVSSVTPLGNFRDTMLKDRRDAMMKKIVLVCFMLLNVFFGIIGTFWLRTQYRRGEMGLRVAVGSSRSRLEGFLYAEGISLLAFTAPLVLIFIINMLYFDMPDTVRLPYTWWRFTVTFGGTFLLLGLMIVVGIWFPARKIAKMDPAEALHYE
ncbi:ABC transporter permease [Parabacteroides chinchillae]